MKNKIVVWAIAVNLIFSAYLFLKSIEHERNIQKLAMAGVMISEALKIVARAGKENSDILASLLIRETKKDGK